MKRSESLSFSFFPPFTRPQPIFGRIQQVRFVCFWLQVAASCECELYVFFFYCVPVNSRPNDAYYKLKDGNQTPMKTKPAPLWLPLSLRHDALLVIQVVRRQLNNIWTLVLWYICRLEGVFATTESYCLLIEKWTISCVREKQKTYCMETTIKTDDQPIN